MLTGPSPKGSMVDIPIIRVSSSTNLDTWSGWATTTSSGLYVLRIDASSFLSPYGAICATPLLCLTWGERKSNTIRGTFSAGAQLKKGSRGMPQYSLIWVASAVSTILAIHLYLKHFALVRIGSLFRPVFPKTTCFRGAMYFKLVFSVNRKIINCSCLDTFQGRKPSFSPMRRNVRGCNSSGTAQKVGYPRKKVCEFSRFSAE